MKKVLLVNGSPHKNGCVFTALSEVAETLKKYNIETEIFHIGNEPVRGCIACRKCEELGKCAFDDDVCNELLKRIQESDGLIMGTPVYYAAPNGALCAILDRVFYSGAKTFAHKPAAAVVSCRRGGASTAFDVLNKYFSINQMPIVTSQYWNSVHGQTAEDVKKDLEGLQTMRTLARNMAWILNSIDKAGLPLPEQEKRERTNFIR